MAAKKPLIGIIGGEGKMGRYFHDFFERNGYPVIVSDRGTRLTNTDLARQADVVIVSVPIDKTEAVIRQVAPRVKKSGLLMDLTSLKVGPMRAMAATKASYFGCHPLFGPTNSMEGQLVALCPGRGQQWLRWLQALLAENKVRVKTLSAKKHDELMAYVQVLSHFSDITLAETLRRSKISIQDFLTYQSPSYRLKLDMMGRILNQDPNLYGNIQVQNPLSKKALRNYLESCHALADLVGAGDLAAFESYFKTAARYLGDYAKKAMESSDHWIRAVIGSRSIEPHQPLAGNETLAVLGPKNTYSDLAAKKIRPGATVYYATSIHDVFRLVAEGQIPEGLVPLENSLTGSVRETLDELYLQNVQASEIIRQPVILSLVSHTKLPLRKIEVVYSHPQALLQCRAFLQKHCPQAITIPLTSTAAALQRVSQESGNPVAAIGAPAAAGAQGLRTLCARAEDNSHNATSFVLISRASKARPPGKNAKTTSIAFHFGKDASGTLHGVLREFAGANVNLTKIESRPSGSVGGKYVFYLDFDGRPDDPVIKKTLKNIRGKVAQLKILGCY